MGIDVVVAEHKEWNGKVEVFNANLHKELFDAHRFYDVAEMRRRRRAPSSTRSGARHAAVDDDAGAFTGSGEGASAKEDGRAPGARCRARAQARRRARAGVEVQGWTGSISGVQAWGAL